MTKTTKQGVFTKTLKNGCTNFYIKYSLHDKQYKIKLGSNLEGWTLHKAHEERMKRILNNNVPIAKKARMSLDMCAEEYLLSIAHKSDYLNTKGRYYNHIHPILGHIPVDKIKVINILSLKLELSKKVSVRTKKALANKTQNDMINLVNSIYKYHNKIHRDNKIDSPADLSLVERLEVNNSRLRFLSHEEYKHLLWFIENRNSFTYNRNANPSITKNLLLYTKLLVSTGIRTYSALTIRCKDIDFISGTISVKNHKSNRTYTVYIHDSIKNELQDICTALDKEYYIFGKGSKPLHRSTLNKRLQPILDKLFNENISDRREKVVVHSLRHTFGSWLVQSGTSLYVVSKLMDHSTIEQTQMYAKLLPNSGADEVSKLDI